MMHRIHHQRNMTWHYQDLMGRARTAYHYWAENHCGNNSCVYGVLKIWQRHRNHAEHRWQRVGSAPSYYDAKYAGLRCIHKYEGAWNANTGNGYYGGLQMDSSFETTYGPEFYSRYGNANNWPPIDQLIAGYRAVTGRGYSAWPNTRLMCGI